MKKTIPLLPTLFLLACAPTAQDRLSERLSENEIKLTRIEQKQADLKKDIEKTNMRIDRLTKLISELRLELERLKLKIEGGVSEKVAEPPKAAPEKRTEKIPEVKPPVGGETPPEIPKEVEEEKPEDAQAAYKRAIELYNLKKLYEARDAFLEFIKRYPENKFTDNAFFWIGKIYQELGDTQRAESVYKSLIEKCESGRLPDCNKLPDAYFQLMQIYANRGDVSKANEYYSILMNRFPTSNAAVKARKLKVLMGE